MLPIVEVKLSSHQINTEYTLVEQKSYLKKIINRNQEKQQTEAA